MSDSDDFNDVLQRMQEQEEQQRQNAQQALAVTCDQLTEMGVTKLRIAYDGYGDSGMVERVQALAGDQETQLPAEMEAIVADAACDLLPGGWEINDGSYGEIIVDVIERRVVREHNWRVTESEYEEEEFSL